MRGLKKITESIKDVKFAVGLMLDSIIMLKIHNLYRF